MDQIGVVCKDPTVGFEALAIIEGNDPKDGMMLPDLHYEPATDSDITIVEDDPEYKDIYTQVMRILCCAEFANNISRYDGIKYGHRAKDYNGLGDLYKKSRTEAFGADVKLATMLGAMVLSQENYSRYYDKAMRIRRLIKDSLEFDKYDAIISRASHPRPLDILARLCGLPALTTPEFTLVANAGREDVLLAASKAVGL